MGSSEPLPDSGAELRAEDPTRIELSFEGPDPIRWFVSVLLIDPIGHPVLLHPRMPEGIELGPGDHEVIGGRIGRREQGLLLPWPAEATEATRGPASLLFLASRRPIELGHIVHAQEIDEDNAFALQRLGREVVRGHTPERARACTWSRFDFTLWRG